MAESKLAGPIGRPLDRVDGRLKVTGRATYAFEYAAQGGAAYGFIVPAAIGKGRVLGVDVRDARARPRCAARPDQGQCAAADAVGPGRPAGPLCAREPALNTDEVRYFGFPVAFVVADTFEQAARRRRAGPCPLRVAARRI